ncbi:HK97 family phage prohead protease [Sphingomonas nostoxanthinifaciens]|uniref:HK97 family phage prohead protease n=1 Tax=Sphingomonas nostoxanthinifaciens TaxID=2872652 RepID=UPI001CC1F7B2|nr:HK97 family phage prohead protease [Sphingomonas nostoxanthinifaciens]UAK25858.1 HK97 family phage prohead protease [Sphingomonas nostoxanthinifaciens]
MLLTKNSGALLDIKALNDDGTFEGYGSVFGNVDSYGEVVEPGAFTASLVDARRKGRSIKLLWQHDPAQPIGTWDDLAEDSKGLYVKGRLLKDTVPQAASAYALLKGGALDGLSIGYRVVEAAPHADKQGILSLKKLDLKEVSLVTFAANDRARVDSVKHQIAAGGMPTVREFEDALRELGFTRSKAEALATACLPHLRGEPEAKADDDALQFLKTLRG